MTTTRNPHSHTMTPTQDPYGTEADTAALLTQDTRTPAERRAKSKAAKRARKQQRRNA